MEPKVPQWIKALTDRELVVMVWHYSTNTTKVSDAAAFRGASLRVRSAIHADSSSTYNMLVDEANVRGVDRFTGTKKVPATPVSVL